MKNILLVDGYNVIGAWPALSKGRTFEEARDELIRRLSNYAGFSGQHVILVFDAYKTSESAHASEVTADLEVVFTAPGETADQFIERVSNELAEKVQDERVKLRVASSDRVEQTVVLGRGALRISSRELILELRETKQQETKIINQRPIKEHTLMSRLPKDIQEKLEKMRRGNL